MDPEDLREVISAYLAVWMARPARLGCRSMVVCRIVLPHIARDGKAKSPN